jgi:hypothetical protein
MSNYINFHEIICSYGAKNVEKLNSFKLQFLMHVTYVSRKITIMNYSYQNFNRTIL